MHLCLAFVPQVKAQHAEVLPASCLLEAPPGYLERLLLVLQANYHVPQQPQNFSLTATTA